MLWIHDNGRNFAPKHWPPNIGLQLYTPNILMQGSPATLILLLGGGGGLCPPYFTFGGLGRPSPHPLRRQGYYNIE